MNIEKKKNGEKKPETPLSLSGLDFEEVLSDLMKIRPVENDDLRKSRPKKKSKPKK